jgi:hypothetical protein
MAARAAAPGWRPTSMSDRPTTRPTSAVRGGNRLAVRKTYKLFIGG